MISKYISVQDIQMKILISDKKNNNIKSIEEHNTKVMNAFEWDI